MLGPYKQLTDQYFRRSLVYAYQFEVRDYWGLRKEQIFQ